MDYDVDGIDVPGEWRKGVVNLEQINSQHLRNPMVAAKQNRNELAEFFMTRGGGCSLHI